MSLDEWDGGLQRFSCFCTMLYHRFLSLLLNGEVLVHLYIR
ncbi:Uncharacterised protein [Segatella copri]|nr:Uncharacterised protein [Segatella copri]